MFLSHSVLRVSLAEEFVNITEGDSGTFCAVIEDSSAQLERNVTVILHTFAGSAEGNVTTSENCCDDIGNSVLAKPFLSGATPLGYH